MTSGEAQRPVQVSIKADVSADTVDTAFSSALETVSPLTELGGAFGDIVRAGRIEIGNLICRRAAAIAKENGYSIKAPPLKFMRQFFEVASLEHQSELHERWAYLLINAGSEQDKTALHMYCADVLSKIDHESMLSFATALHIAPSVVPRERLSFSLDQICQKAVEACVDVAEDVVTFSSTFPKELERRICAYDARLADYGMSGNRVNNNNFLCVGLSIKFWTDQKTTLAGSSCGSHDFCGKTYVFGRSSAALPSVFGLLDVYDHECRVEANVDNSQLPISASVAVVSISELGKKFAEACGVDGSDARLHRTIDI